MKIAPHRLEQKAHRFGGSPLLAGSGYKQSLPYDCWKTLARWQKMSADGADNDLSGAVDHGQSDCAFLRQIESLPSNDLNPSRPDSR
jgi:hypothetical protein